MNPHYWHENVVILHMSVHKTLCLFLGKFIFHSGLSIILRFYCSVLAVLSFTVEITGILNKLLDTIVGWIALKGYGRIFLYLLQPNKRTQFNLPYYLNSFYLDFNLFHFSPFLTNPSWKGQGIMLKLKSKCERWDLDKRKDGIYLFCWKYLTVH